jgi:hypothetical protein
LTWLCQKLTLLLQNLSSKICIQATSLKCFCGLYGTWSWLHCVFCYLWHLLWGAKKTMRCCAQPGAWGWSPSFYKFCWNSTQLVSSKIFSAKCPPAQYLTVSWLHILCVKLKGCQRQWINTSISICKSRLPDPAGGKQVTGSQLSYIELHARLTHEPKIPSWILDFLHYPPFGWTIFNFKHLEWRHVWISDPCSSWPAGWSARFISHPSWSARWPSLLPSQAESASEAIQPYPLKSSANNWCWSLCHLNQQSQRPCQLCLQSMSNCVSKNHVPLLFLHFESSSTHHWPLPWCWPFQCVSHLSP